MDYFKCLNCGCCFDDEEKCRFTEYVGECHGEKLFRNFDGCPVCGGEFDLARECEFCGCIEFEENLEDDVCKNCIEDLLFSCKYNVKKCYNIAEESGEKETVKLNSFVAFMFTESEINEILLKELCGVSAEKSISCQKFIDSDGDWFIGQAIEHEKKIQKERESKRV